jgi:glycerophosphoryl diester phosphodiesterase
MHARFFILVFGLLAQTTSSSMAQDAIRHSENFDHLQTLTDQWKIISGDWKLADGALVANSIDSEAYIAFGDESWQDYEIDVTVTFREVRDPSRWLSLLVRATKNGETPWSQIPVRFESDRKNGIEFAVRTDAGDWSVRKTAAAPPGSQLNQPRHLRVVVRRSTVEGFLDGQSVLQSHLCVDRSTGCVGLGVSGCVASFDDFSVRQFPSQPGTVVASDAQCDNVAHRGFSSVAPENTLAAIDQAVDAGASGCEFDVYGCRDGTVVLMHDKTVDRTTSGKGRVTDLSWDELRQLDAGSWKNVAYAGQKVPSLRQSLRRLSGTNCQPVIEIKMEGISQQVIDDVRALDMVDQVAVIAFSQAVVREIRELEPKIRCAWLCSETLRGSTEEQANWLEKQAQTCKATTLDLNYKMLSPDLVAELKRRGFGVWTWTVNEAAVMRALSTWGVDSITTDRPDVLAEILEKQQ